MESSGSDPGGPASAPAANASDIYSHPDISFFRNSTKATRVERERPSFPAIHPTSLWFG
jgi:hypothetical protein